MTEANGEIRQPSRGSSHRKISFTGDMILDEDHPHKQDWIPRDIRERANAAYTTAVGADTNSVALTEVPRMLEGLIDTKELVDDFMRKQSVCSKEQESLTKNEFIALAAALREHQESVTGKSEIPAGMLSKLQAIFNKMDVDGDKKITKEEATDFWHSNFSKINAGAMFNEVDVDGDGHVTQDEWLNFWRNVLRHGYNNQEVEEELDELMVGGSWVDFNDGRNT